MPTTNDMDEHNRYEIAKQIEDLAKRVRSGAIMVKSVHTSHSVEEHPQPNGSIIRKLGRATYITFHTVIPSSIIPTEPSTQDTYSKCEYCKYCCRWGTPYRCCCPDMFMQDIVTGHATLPCSQLNPDGKCEHYQYKGDKQ